MLDGCLYITNVVKISCKILIISPACPRKQGDFLAKVNEQ